MEPVSVEDLAAQKGESSMEQRARALFAEQQLSTYIRTDKLFGALLLVEWLAGILVALIVSPRTWAGHFSDMHFHVIVATVLGALIVARPIYLSHFRAGETVTRHSIAVGQMLFSALLIHLTGGRIESHFHIFGSLAFLSFYRDWRVIITASVVTAIDHLVRGYFYPISIYGTTAMQPFRWLEHTWWVVFEDYFLIRSMGANIKDIRAQTLQQSEVEATRANVQALVDERTKELKSSRAKLSTQYALTSTLADSRTLAQAAPGIMAAVQEGILSKAGAVVGVLLEFQNLSGVPLRKNDIKLEQDPLSMGRLFNDTDYLIENLELPRGIKTACYKKILGIPTPGPEPELQTVLYLPISAGEEIKAIILFLAEQRVSWDESENSMMESLCRQMSEFLEQRNTELYNVELARIVQYCGDAIVGYAPDGRIQSWNKGAERLFGYSFEEMKNQLIGHIFPDDGKGEINKLLDALAQGRIIESAEAKCLTKSGRLKDVSFTQSPVLNERKAVTGASLIIHDISERLEAERRVGEFYSVVSHELRTPLTSIRSALGLIEGGVVDLAGGEGAELVQIARSSTDRLIRLINDMLDLKKIEAGKMEFHGSWGRTGNLLSSVIEAFSSMSRAGDITLSSRLDFDGPVLGDQDKLLQVLTNLVSNAIKFSPAGSTVILSASLDESSEQGKSVRFSVQDSGPGISPIHINKLFEKFQQLDASDSRSAGGTGLGLAICKAIITEHGGKIGVVSEEGKGSTFWFTIPSGSQTSENSSEDLAEHEEVDKAKKEHTFRILLVEDDVALSKVLGKCLQKAGHVVTLASSVADAQESLGKTKFDVLIVDVQLGDGNGLDLVHYLRDGEQAEIPVIVITGGTDAQEARGQAIVFDWLAKPFEGNTLVDAVQRAIGRSKRKRVLLVDDDPHLRRIVASQLRGIGLDCLEAEDGLAAIHKAKTENPELIILDVVLPKLDAFEILQVLKEGNTANIPLLIYTGKDLSATERKALSLGVTRHLTKGRSNQKDLVDAVQSLLGELGQPDTEKLKESRSSEK